MPLLTIISIIIMVGVLLWTANAFLPMEGKVKSILNLVVIACLIVWLLRVFGIWTWLMGVHV